MKRFDLLLIVFLFASLTFVYAHEPRYVFNQENIIVKNPETSQAFYGELNGISNTYIINSDKEFNLYVNILAPDLPDSRTDFIVQINPINISLNGENYNWTGFYEEFAGDNYLAGPEFDMKVPAGTYNIIISNPGNIGKYSLAIGKIEKFSIKDLLVLPLIKKNFFNKSYFATFQGIIGKGLLILLIVLILIILLIVYIIKKIRKKK